MAQKEISLGRDMKEAFYRMTKTVPQSLDLRLFVTAPYKLVAVLSPFTASIPTFYLNHLANQKYIEFSKQFPDALNLMASSLRAGHPLFSAISRE
jgi:Flp pilus assembly protein TadB